MALANKSVLVELEVGKKGAIVLTGITGTQQAVKQAYSLLKERTKNFTIVLSESETFKLDGVINSEVEDEIILLDLKERSTLMNTEYDNEKETHKLTLVIENINNVTAQGILYVAQDIFMYKGVTNTELGLAFPFMDFRYRLNENNEFVKEKKQWVITYWHDKQVVL